MQENTRDFLIRKMPAEVYMLLEESAKEHFRSMTQEAIVILKDKLTPGHHQIRQPVPFKWKKNISNQFIQKAIEEGRE